MRKLDALVSFFIKDCNFTAAENDKPYFIIDEFLPSGNYVDNGFNTGICAYDQVYTAVINFERFPHKRYSLDYVLSRLTEWIFANDPIIYRKRIATGSDNELIDLEPPDVNIDPDLLDDETAQLEIQVQFREPVFWVLDANGAFDYDGNKWRLADAGVSAEQFERNYIINRS